jgi:hypothetical protein
MYAEKASGPYLSKGQLPSRDGFSELARTTIDIIGKRVETAPTKKRFPSRLFDNHFNPPNDKSTGNASPAFKMRTYDDSFSGQKIYPGKVRYVIHIRGISSDRVERRTVVK